MEISLHRHLVDEDSWDEDFGGVGVGLWVFWVNPEITLSTSTTYTEIETTDFEPRDPSDPADPCWSWIVDDL